MQQAWGVPSGHSDRDLEHRNDAEQRAEGASEFHRDQQRDFDHFGVDVVLNHDLQPELGRWRRR